MSLADSFQNSSMEGWDAQSVRVDMSPDDVFHAQSAFSGVDMGGFSHGLLDTFFDRNRGVAPLQAAPDFNAGAKAEAAGPDQKPGMNLQAAWNTARAFQPETAKLEAGKITAASGPGARSANNFIEAKAAATTDLRANIAAVRKETRGQQGPQVEAGVKPGTGPVGLARNFAVSAVVGAVVDMVAPGAGTTMTVAAMGAGSFGAKGAKSEFSSAADKGLGRMYQTSPGHDSVDIMRPGARPAVSGRDIDRRLSSGPGFGMGEIEHIVEPSLRDARPTFDEKQLAALEATADEMKRDVDLGANAYKNWMASDVSVTESIGSTPISALKVDDEDMAALTRDNPALEETMKPPTISAMKLA